MSPSRSAHSAASGISRRTEKSQLLTLKLAEEVCSTAETYDAKLLETWVSQQLIAGRFGQSWSHSTTYTLALAHSLPYLRKYGRHTKASKSSCWTKKLMAAVSRCVSEVKSRISASHSRMTSRPTFDEGFNRSNGKQIFLLSFGIWSTVRSIIAPPRTPSPYEWSHSMHGSRQPVVTRLDAMPVRC